MMIQSSENIGCYIRRVRKALNVTQKDLALTAGTGLRFIIDLENGKPTCQIGKTLQVLQVLGIQLNLSHTEFENEKS
jgi:HTH-type transcriptional regulator / antitoxin HipB